MIGSLLFCAGLGMQGIPSVSLRPLYETPPRPGRWFPLVAEGGSPDELEGIELRSASGRSAWRLGRGGAKGEMLAVFFERGQRTAILTAGDGAMRPVFLPPEEDSPAALAVGEGGEGPLRAGGYRVVRAEASSLVFDPLALDVFDLVWLSAEEAKKMAPGTAERIRACVAAGTRVRVEPEGVRPLFGDLPPGGLLEEVPPASTPARTPLALHSGGRRPSPIEFARLRSAEGAFLVGWIVTLLALPAFLRRVPAVRGARPALFALVGVAGISGAALVPVPLDRPIEIVHTTPSEARAVRAEVHGPRSRVNRVGRETSVRPAIPDGQVEVLAGGREGWIGFEGWALTLGGGSPPPRTLEWDRSSDRFVDPFGPLGPGVWLREGKVVGLTPRLAPGEPVPRPGESEIRRADRATAAVVELLAPRSGLTFLAPLSRGKGSCFVIADLGED